MIEDTKRKNEIQRSEFSKEVGSQAARKLKARRHSTREVWLGLGVMGLIGWSVVVPTLLGALLGIWLDKHFPGSHSWTLMLLVTGLVLGCFNAWQWVDKQDKEMTQKQENGDE
ncbi:MAG: AtpZ/AtpI family protein [Candidatus Melainabacteria bacterium]|nr:AtpZ/AtpI family protein [Candidatus Melainabacteria bacterium]